MSELPRGWTHACLPELAGPRGVFCDGDWVESKDQDPDGDVRLVQLADIGDGFYRNRSSRFLTLSKARELRCTFLAPGDVLIARMPEPLGRACLFPGDTKPSVTAVDVCIVRPDPSLIDARWLMHVLNAPQSRTAIAAFAKGTTRKRISRGNLARIPLPVPPLVEQRRILAAIEELFAHVDAGLASVQVASLKLRSYSVSALEDAVRRWQQVPLNELVWSLRNGIFVSRPGTETTRRPILRISAVRPLSVDASDVRYVPDSTILRQEDAFRVHEGDLLFVRYNGNADLVGVCGLVREDAVGLLHPDKLIRAVVDRTVVMPEYLEIALNCGPSLQAIRERKKTTAGQVGIAGSALLSVPVPLPPLERQGVIVAAVHELLEGIGRLRDAIAPTHVRSARLRSSILSAAFTGRLTALGLMTGPYSPGGHRNAAVANASPANHETKQSLRPPVTAGMPT